MTTARELNATLPYATNSELEWLSLQASMLPDHARVAMIGGGPCVMGLAVLEGNPHLELCIIDLLDLNYCRTHIESAFPDVLVRYLPHTRSDSVDWPDLSLLIIDGSHEYENVLSDCRVWLRCLNENCYALFHDYDAGGTPFSFQEQYPGVKLALHKFLKRERDKYAFEGMVGTSAIVKRKP